MGRFIGRCVLLLAVVLTPRSVAGQDKPLVLAHYMPWFVVERGDAETKFGWHWTMGHFSPAKTVKGLPEIAARHHPAIGLYDSGDRHVIEYHLLTMKLAGIDGVIVDWYGQVDLYDYYTIHRNTTRVLEACERLKMKFAICYEDKTLTSLVKEGRVARGDRVTHAAGELNWLGKYWFKSGSYVRLSGKPLLLSFGESGLTDTEWSACLKQLTTSIAWFSEHRQRPGADGAYDWPEPSLGLAMQTRFEAEAKNRTASIPVVYPRFDDMYAEAGVSKGYPVIPDNRGATFRETLNRAIAMKPKVIQIATWNDWGEGTDIEPSKQLGNRDLEVLRQSFNPKANGNDLELPRLLLSRRRKSGSDQTKLNDIAQKIVVGDLAAARRSLSY